MHSQALINSTNYLQHVILTTTATDTSTTMTNKNSTVKAYVNVPEFIFKSASMDSVRKAKKPRKTSEFIQHQPANSSKNLFRICNPPSVPSSLSSNKHRKWSWTDFFLATHNS